MTARYDDRYKPTPADVRIALRIRNPDPFGHNEMPWTEFQIAAEIAHRRGKRGRPIGRSIQRNTLRQLLAEMAENGTIVAKTGAEWYALRRNFPTRSQDPEYTTPENFARWQAADAASETTNPSE